MAPSLGRLPLALALLVLLSFQIAAQSPDLARHFDYDNKAPLDISMLGTERRPHATIHDLTYASPRGGAVPAYLVVPSQGKGPFAAVIWGHWYWQNSPMRNRKEFLDEAVALAQAGVVSLLTDGPIARPGYVEETTPMNDKQAMYFLQQVLDMRS